jgi:hypothetical protein
MKTIKFTVAFVLMLFSFQNIEAQFGKANKVQLPENYDFNWVMKMEMKTKKGNMQMDYYLKEGAKYFGIKNEQLAKQAQGGKMFMVMDANLEVMAIFMDMMGRKILQKTSMKNDEQEQEEMDNYTYKKIGSKTILGYECEGFVAESDEHQITFYVTNQVPVSFTHIWGNDKKTMPKGFNTAWMKKYADNGAVLEMNFVDKKKSKFNSTMICTAIEKTDFTIKTSNYKSMF